MRLCQGERKNPSQSFNLSGPYLGSERLRAQPASPRKRPPKYIQASRERSLLSTSIRFLYQMSNTHIHWFENPVLAVCALGEERERERDEDGGRGNKKPKAEPSRFSSNPKCSLCLIFFFFFIRWSAEAKNKPKITKKNNKKKERQSRSAS